MPSTTPSQLFPVPTDADDPNVPEDITTLANAIEKRTVQKFSSIAQRDERNPTPEEGELCYVADVSGADAWYYYDGTTWVRLYLSTTPPPKITVGTGTPSGGSNGDVHFRV